MRKLSMLFLAAVFSLPLTAYCQKTSFGITGGLALANMHLKSEGFSVSPGNKAGLTAGVLVDVPLSGNFSFQPALNYVQKGYKMSEADYKDKLTINYVELPLNFLFKPNMPQVHFFVGAGPSIAYALSGKEKEDDAGRISTYKFKFGNNPDEHDLKALDLGANFITGIETKSGFLVAINYNLGLSNVAPGSSSDGTSRNRYFGFKSGYLIKGKK